MNNVKVEKNNRGITRIIKGLLLSFAITFISLFIFAILLTYTNLSESLIPVVTIALTFISILIGTMIGVRKMNKNGMLNGAMIGGFYVLLLYFISSILGTGFTMNLYTIFMIIGGILAGMIGGIIGINT